MNVTAWTNDNGAGAPSGNFATAGSGHRALPSAANRDGSMLFGGYLGSQLSTHGVSQQLYGQPASTASRRFAQRPGRQAADT